MRFTQTEGNLHTNLYSLIEWHRRPSDPLLQAFAFYVGHCDVDPPTNRTDVIDGADVGMVQGGGGTCFVKKPCFARRIERGRFIQKLQGNGSIKLRIKSPEENTHSALPDLAERSESTHGWQRQSLGDVIIQCDHVEPHEGIGIRR